MKSVRFILLISPIFWLPIDYCNPGDCWFRLTCWDGICLTYWERFFWPRKSVFWIDMLFPIIFWVPNDCAFILNELPKFCAPLLWVEKFRVYKLFWAKNCCWLTCAGTPVFGLKFWTPWIFGVVVIELVENKCCIVLKLVASNGCWTLECKLKLKF